MTNMSISLMNTPMQLPPLTGPASPGAGFGPCQHDVIGTHFKLLFLCLTLGLATSAQGALFTTNTTIAAGSTTYDGQPIVVSNCTLTVNGSHSFASLQVSSNGVVTHSAAPNGEATNVLALTITGDVGVDASSRIDVSGRGYAALNGPGAGTANPGGWGRGAGHGGVGGTAVYYGGSGGGAYDSATTPNQWGSGGGSGSGGPGGGMAVLNIAGTLRVAGTLSADGSAAPNPQCGGGAGGSLWINAGTLTGNGSIVARGGAGGVTEGGGAGGGGRIALYFTYNTFGGTISAAGALGYQNSGAGTIYTKAASESTGHMLVDNNGTQGLWTPLSAPEAFELVVANFGQATMLASMTNSSFTIRTNGLLTYTAGLSNFTVTVLGNATIDLGGRFDLSGLGFGSEKGPGAGARDGGGWGSGGGHGGVGGYSYWQKPGGGAYDSITTPTQWGSGGGSSTGGAGGGSVALSVAGTLRVNGALAADGFVPSNVQHGGGAGGSLWIKAVTLTGNGLITARGGAGGATQGGGGGGGGRIAVYFTQNTFAGTLSASGGVGLQNGGAGTIYTKSASESTGHALVDNSGNVGEWTPLSAPEAFSMVIARGGKVRALAPLTLSALRVETNAVLSNLPGLSNLCVTVAGNADIDAGGQLDVNGLGYTAEQGPGAGAHDSGGWGSGGGHGGVGGYSYYQTTGGSVYDSIVTPTQFGSGGGVVDHNGISGGPGGGAMVLNVGGILRIDGSLTADGAASPNVQYGGGAGGSLWITAGHLTGGGLMAARGGVGGPTQGGGGGSGGRIALYLTQNTFAGTVSAVGGLGYQNGGAGTVYTKLAADAHGQVLVDNAGNAGLTRLNSSGWPAGLVFDLTLSGAAIVKPDAPQTFRNLVLTNGAVATHDPAQAGFFWTCLGNAWISSNASFNMDGMGFGTAAGPGHGTNSGYGYGSGGGHGGSGAVSYNGGVSVAPGGITYGSSSAPVTLGSGGGASSGARGGGALRLTVNGTLHLDGTLSANGLVAPATCGSGAGGSIWITASSLTGGGSVQAAGGAAAAYGAAGGGGRIAIDTYSMAGFETNRISAATGGAGAGVGTLVFSYPPPSLQAGAAGPALRISWLTGSNATYQIWSTPDFKTWSPYGPPRTGTGGILTQDCPMTNSPGLFFQVQMGN